MLIVAHDAFDLAERDVVTTAIAEVLADFDTGAVTDEFIYVRGDDPLPEVDGWAYMRY